MNAGNTTAMTKHGRRTHLSTYMLALFFILLPFEYPMATFGFGSILRYVGMAVMAFAVLDILMDGGKIHFDYRCILLAIWLVFMLTSVLWSEDLENYSHFSGIYLRNAIMFLLISLVHYDEWELSMLCNAYMLGLVLLLLYMTFVPGAVMYSDWQNRLTLVTGEKDGLDQNYLATVMSLPFGLIFYDFINGNRKLWVRAVQIMVCAACIYYVFATGSRTGILELALIALFCFGVGWKKNLLVIIIVVSVLFFLIPLLIETLPEALVERYSLEAIMGQADESSSRLTIWESALQAIADGNWLFGYGAGSSEYVIGCYLASDHAVHNYYLAHILELGLIGFSLFTTMGVKMVREVWYSSYRKVAVAFIGILVSTMFLDVLTTKFFWSGMMLMTVAFSVGRAQNAEGGSHAKKRV